MKWIYLFLIGLFLVSCKEDVNTKDFLLSFNDSLTDEYGYKDLDGKIVIPKGKYEICFTDTFKYYAIVYKKNKGFIAIDRNQKELYNVFIFDNGPDYNSEGTFRIIKDNKIGYADAKTGNIIIQPKYTCAYNFSNGLAKVSTNCSIEKVGEYTLWKSEKWYYINKKGLVQKSSTTK